MSYSHDIRTIYVPAFCADNQQRANDIYCSSVHGTVYYRPRDAADSAAIAASPPSFPVPLIRGRQRRPHSIHIVSYPPGYIPTELRPKPPRPPGETQEPQTKESRKESKKQPKKKTKKKADTRERRTKAKEKETDQPAGKTVGRTLGLLLCSLPFRSGSPTAPPATTPRRTVSTKSKPRPVSIFSIGSRFSRVPETIYEDRMTQTPTLVEALTIRPRLVAGGMQSSSHRNSIMSNRSIKSVMSSSVAEVVNKPVASGSGVSCSIVLAEPNLFLTGFEHEGRSRQQSSSATALLRGKLLLTVSKNVKIKAVTLKLTGHARTEWPEGIPPAKMETSEEESLRTQALTFFHAMHDSWQTPYGNQCTYKIKGAPDNDSTTNLGTHPLSGSPNPSMFALPRTTAGMTAREVKRFSLQPSQMQGFGRTESPVLSPTQVKGYKVFHPGTYEYSFEMPIDHHQLETTKLPYGSVKWELETTVERAGAFKPNLHGSKEVSVVRVPDQLSLETSEPIAISRRWEDQLHYDIIISGKSFPIGTKIPIAFKLTPLAKVQVHKLKVFVTESVEYWTNDRRVTRKDGGRKILLLEKTAGKPLDKQYEGSEIRVLNGGELSPDQRHEARAAAARRRIAEASRTNTLPGELPEPVENLLGDIDLGLESYWGSTEMELNVQIPTCEQMAKDKTKRLHPDCSWKNVNVFHWIKIVMRISRLDPDDPAQKRRRHFEISIDSPFTVLNCRATQANMMLPQYSGPELPGFRQQAACGCPDAEILATNPSPASSTGTLPLADANDVSSIAMPAAPEAAHVHHASTLLNAAAAAASSPVPSRPVSMVATPSPLARVLDQEDFQNPRPIHLMRVPSFDPPAFDADHSPPPMEILSPPPQYDHVIGTPSVDGLADYFARREAFEGISLDGVAEEESDSGDEGGGIRRITSRTGRVHVANPRTPGGRLVPSRSLDIERPNVELVLPARDV